MYGGLISLPEITRDRRSESLLAEISARAQHVVEEIVDERNRAIHAPPGVDIAAVVRHCVAARRQKVVRDALLAVDLCAALVLFLGTRSLFWLVLGFLLAWATVAWDMWSATYGVVRKHMNPRVFDPNDAPRPADQGTARRIEELAERQQGNLTIYSGFLPFAGAGGDLGGWSFVVDLSKCSPLGPSAGADTLVPSTLYDAVRAELQMLADPNLLVEDRLFVNGADIREDRSLLPDPSGAPASTVDEQTLIAFMARPTERIRHYQCIRVLDWRGELVVSMFLRFSIGNERLFCELSRFLLVPLKDELRRAERLSMNMELRYALSIAGRSLRATAPLSLRSPSVVLKPLYRSRQRAARAKQVEHDVFFDYGAPRTALDRVRSHRYSHYFQLLDKERHVKILDRTVLDAIVAVLDAHGIDTQELAERRTTIINHGIMIPGGSIQAENVAVGEKASIVGRMRAASGASASPAPGGGTSS